MEDNNRRLHGVIAEVRIEARQVHRHHQAFIGHHGGGQRTHIKMFVVADTVFRTTTGEEQTTVHFQVGNAIGTDQHLGEGRQRLHGDTAEAVDINRHVTPGQYAQVLARDFLVEDRFLRRRFSRIRAEEQHADAVGIRQRDRQLFGHLAEEGIGLLQQQATTVAGLAVCVDAASVRHTGECFDRGLQKFVAWLALHLGNQAKPAVVAEFSGLM